MILLRNSQIIKRVRRFAQPLFFPPRFGGFLPTNKSKYPKVFWGVPRAKLGGPNVRTKRLIDHFGNNLLNPNIVYAQSGWNIGSLKEAIKYKRSGRGKIIFNQNGWYYEGWYSGNSHEANSVIVEAQKQANFVIFQSRFCLEAGRELNNFVPKDYEILFNCVPTYAALADEPGDGRTCWLSGVFTPDSEHILVPAFQAFDLLRRKNYKASSRPKLLLAGYLHPDTIKADWFIKLKPLLDSLLSDETCEWIGVYSQKELPKLLSRVDVALHLKYKDPCPNAVIERIMFGIPHVYSNSGGTPELISEAGIPIGVTDTWEKLIPVDVCALTESILKALQNKKQLKNLANERKKYFSWNDYTNRHLEIFMSVL